MAAIWVQAFPPEPDRNERFRGLPGVRNMPAANSPPVTYFYLLFTVELMKEIVRRTNSYARHTIRNGAARVKRYAREKLWKPLSVKELKSFIAIIFNIGLIRKSSIEEYWNTIMPSQSSGWFRKVMSRNRFQNILKFLYVSDHSRNVPRQHPAYDPASRFRPLLSFMNKQFCRFLVPEREVCVDETLMATKGHNVMRQYIPSKAAKFGIKFWMLCESTSGYILRMTVYRGRSFDPVPVGQLQGTQVVVDLMRASDLLNKGYHVFCDSIFCSINLATKLLNNNTFLTGTLRKNRPMPNTIKNGNPQPNHPIYMRKGKLICACFRDVEGKKPVRMLSSVLPAQNLPSGRPRIVNSYNKNMGAVDTTDALMKAYSGQRKHKKPWKKVVLHLFNRILQNSFILYQKNSSETPLKTRLKFIQEVIEALSETQRCVPPVRQRRNRGNVSLSTLPGRKEKDCCVCSDRSRGGVRRRSRTSCRLCGKGLHRDCVNLHQICRTLRILRYIVCGFIVDIFWK